MGDIDKRNATKGNLAWYFKPSTIIFAILFFGPLGLFLLWFRPKTSLSVKITVSLVVIALTVLMTIQAVKTYQQLLKYLHELDRVMHG